MKTVLFALALLLGSSSALAIDISESMLNSFVAQKLAEKQHRDVQLLAPKITLLDGHATLCATVQIKPETRTCKPTVNPADTNPLPESL